MQKSKEDQIRDLLKELLKVDQEIKRQIEEFKAIGKPNLDYVV